MYFLFFLKVYFALEKQTLLSASKSPNFVTGSACAGKHAYINTYIPYTRNSFTFVVIAAQEEGQKKKK
jgi:hypothetical protein